jgi:hypothetical protein
LPRNQLKASEINGFTPPLQLLSDNFGVITHKTLVDHGA